MSKYTFKFPDLVPEEHREELTDLLTGYLTGARHYALLAGAQHMYRVWGAQGMSVTCGQNYPPFSNFDVEFDFVD